MPIHCFTLHIVEWECSRNHVICSIWKSLSIWCNFFKFWLDLLFSYQMEIEGINTIEIVYNHLLSCVSVNNICSFDHLWHNPYKRLRLLPNLHIAVSLLGLYGFLLLYYYTELHLCLIYSTQGSSSKTNSQL